MKKPSRRPPDSALQMRPACTSAKFAEGKACLCASGIVRYWTAYAEELAEMTTAAGTVQCIHFAMLHLVRELRRSGELLLIAARQSFFIAASMPASEEEPDSAENGVSSRAKRVIVLHPLIGCLEHDVGGREHRDARGVKMRLSGAGRHVQIGPREPAGLEVLVRIAIERNGFPLAAQYRAERHVKGDFAGVTEHGLADVISGIGVIIGAQIFRVTEGDVDIFATQLHRGVGNAITKFGVEHDKARPAERVAEVIVRLARRRIRSVVGAHAPTQARKEWRREVQFSGIGQVVAELPKIAHRRPRESKRGQSVDTGQIGYREEWNGVGLRSQAEIVAEVLEAAADLQLIFDALRDRPVDAGGRRPPGRGDQAIIELRPVDAVELGRLVVLVDIADRNEVDARRAPIELIQNEEIDEYLLDVDRAVQLVVGVEGDAAVLEFDLGVEDDVRSDRVGRQQNETVGVEAVLPLAIGKGILEGAVFDLAIGADAETRHRRIGNPENRLAARR